MEERGLKWLGAVACVPLVALQVGCAWLNLSMLPRGVVPGAREGLALIVLYAADGVWLLTATSLAGLGIGLSVMKGTRFGFTWWLVVASVIASFVAFGIIVPSRV